MHEIFQITKLISDNKSEELQIAGIAKHICDHEEILTYQHFMFFRSFPKNHRSTSVPHNLKLLIAMILEGTSSNANIVSQACVTIRPLFFTFQKEIQDTSSGSKKNPRTQNPELPLPLYLGLKVHFSFTISRKMFDQRHMLGINVSYALSHTAGK